MFAIIIFIVWLICILVLRKINLNFFVFIIGSIGTFCFLMYIGIGLAEKKLEYLVTYVVGIAGSILNLFTAYPEYSMITSYSHGEAISFYIDYECSGFVETLVFSCLLLYYPIYKKREKALLLLFGIAFIFILNIIRVIIICLIVKVFGKSYFFFSHTIFARVLFFVNMIVLYFIVFTKPHILRQKVGNLNHAK